MTIEILRQYRIFGYAIFDLVVSFAGIYFIAPLLSGFFFLLKIEIPRQNWIYLTLPLGIFVHLLTGNFTPMTNNFLDLNGSYLLKILILGLLVFGLRGIKLVR